MPQSSLDRWTSTPDDPQPQPEAEPQPEPQPDPGDGDARAIPETIDRERVEALEPVWAGEWHRLACPWCLSAPDQFRVHDNGITGCGECSARIPVGCDWYLRGEKINVHD